MDEESKPQESSQPEEREDHGTDESVYDANKWPIDGATGCTGCWTVAAIAALPVAAGLLYGVRALLTTVL